MFLKFFLLIPQKYMVTRKENFNVNNSELEGLKRENKKIIIM